MNNQFGENPYVGNTIKDQVSEAVDNAQEKMAEVGRRAAETVDETRRSSADALTGAATTIRERADHMPGRQQFARVAHATADKIQTTADYIRDHDTGAMVRDVEGLIRRYPGQSLIVATVAGFLVGRLLRTEGRA